MVFSPREFRSSPHVCSTQPFSSGASDHVHCQQLIPALLWTLHTALHVAYGLSGCSDASRGVPTGSRLRRERRKRARQRLQRGSNCADSELAHADVEVVSAMATVVTEVGPPVQVAMDGRPDFASNAPTCVGPHAVHGEAGEREPSSSDMLSPRAPPGLVAALAASFEPVQAALNERPVSAMVFDIASDADSEAHSIADADNFLAVSPMQAVGLGARDGPVHPLHPAHGMAPVAGPGAHDGPAHLVHPAHGLAPAAGAGAH